MKKLIKWVPRILTILAISFMSIFSFDCVDGVSFVDIITCLFMHNIPSYIAIIGLILAWTKKSKRKILGGSILILHFIAFAIVFGSFTGNWGSLIILTPFLLSGGLFIVDAVAFGIKEKFQHPVSIGEYNNTIISGTITDLSAQNNVYLIWRFDANGTNMALDFSGVTEFTEITFSGIFPTKEIQIWCNNYNTEYAFIGTGKYETHSIPIIYSLYVDDNLKGRIDFYCPTAIATDEVSLDYLAYIIVN